MYSWSIYVCIPSPNCMLTVAAAPFKMPKALTMGGGMRSWGWLILKFDKDLCVWAPQYLSAGTCTSPNASVSALVSAMTADDAWNCLSNRCWDVEILFLTVLREILIAGRTKDLWLAGEYIFLDIQEAIVVLEVVDVRLGRASFILTEVRMAADMFCRWKSSIPLMGGIRDQLDYRGNPGIQGE